MFLTHIGKKSSAVEEETRWATWLLCDCKMMNQCVEGRYIIPFSN